MVGGRVNQIVNDSQQSFIAGGAYSEINSNGSYNLMLTPFQAEINDDSSTCNIINSNYGRIRGASYGSTIIGGRWGSSSYRNDINNLRDGFIFGGHHNLMTANDSGNNELNAIIVSDYTTIGDSKNKVVMLGTQNRTAEYSFYTHVENLKVYGAVTYETYSGGSVSNVQTFDANNGMVQIFDNPVGNVNAEIINVKNGEVYDMIITSPGAANVNSVSTTDVGFTIYDNNSGVAATVIHLRIAVVNNLIVVSQL